MWDNYCLGWYIWTLLRTSCSNDSWALWVCDASMLTHGGLKVTRNSVYSAMLFPSPDFWFHILIFGSTLVPYWFHVGSSLLNKYQTNFDKCRKTFSPKMFEIDFHGLMTLRLAIWITYFYFFLIWWDMFCNLFWSNFMQISPISPWKGHLIWLLFGL